MERGITTAVRNSQFQNEVLVKNKVWSEYSSQLSRNHNLRIPTITSKYGGKEIELVLSSNSSSDCEIVGKGQRGGMGETES